VVPRTWIGEVRWTPNMERWEIGFETRLYGAKRDDLTVSVRLSIGDRLLAGTPMPLSERGTP